MKPDTRTALLDTAEVAARTRGFDGFSYADLSDAVGIRKASIHYHFPTKAGLSSALMERYHAGLEARCEAIDAQEPTASGRLRALVDLYRDALGGGEMLCLCVSMLASRESLSDEVRAQLVRFRAMMRDWIGTVFELGRADGSIGNVGDTASEASAALAMLEGAHLAARAEADPRAFDDALEPLMARCLS